VRAIRQLPLPFTPDPRYATADFREAASNQAARTWLGRTEDWPGRRLLLWGEAGCGKTHLLHIWAVRSGAVVWTGPALRGIPELPAEKGIAIDAADAVEDETALFHLLNATAEAGLPVLLAARQPPSRWIIRLPDLASRLRAITAVEIEPPEDALLRALLSRLLGDRQLRLPESVQEWLLLRLPRTASALCDAVARLDAAALEAKRDITVPLARDVLGELVTGEAEQMSGSEAPLAERPGSPVGSHP